MHRLTGPILIVAAAVFFHASVTTGDTQSHNVGTVLTILTATAGVAALLLLRGQNKGQGEH